MSAPIVVVGSLNVDLVVRAERFPAPGATVTGEGFAVVPGGKGANQACAAARLGGDVRMVGCVGADAHGTLVRRSLAEAGADVAHVRAVRGTPTGVALITVDGAGENTIVVVPGANARLTPDALDEVAAAFDRAAVVLLQLEVPLPTVQEAARRARAAGARVVLDPAPARPLPDALLALVDYLTPNQTELAALAAGAAVRDAGEATAAARELLGRGARNVVVKRGEEGALLVGADGACAWPAPRVRAVDATAAGDAWNGAFAFGLARGDSTDAAGRLATAAASVSVTRAGAQPSLPTLAEAEAWWKGGS
jgi:ribokinase